MRYNKNNIPLQCIMTQSTCYKQTTTMQVKGILIHSTGANNPTLKRYVQPDDNAKDRKELLNILGVNNNKNDWNHIYIEAGVNAWIGKLADGTVTTVQTLPWLYKPWGCGKGSRGSCNNGWIQFECCEDALTDKNYFLKVYNEACELMAYLCKKFNINPLGKVSFAGTQVPTILCHRDSYNLGLGSGHIDVLHWFPKFGKTMDNLRQDVYNLLNETKEEEEEVTQKQFNAMMDNWLAAQATKEPSDWSAVARDWAEKNSFIQGDENGNKMYKKFLSREEFAQVLYRVMNNE